MHYQDERNFGCRVSDAWTYRGLKTAIIENELLRVVVLVDKGADIYQFVHKPTDVDFLLRSPLGVRDPRRYVATTGSPIGLWMDTYEGGWQTVLPAGGYPAEYKGAELGLHAEASNMPWDCAVLEDSPERVSMKFWVRTPRLPHFFEKTLTLTAGSGVLDISEALVNEGEESVDVVWGEHIALGAPFLSEDCLLDLPGGTIINHPAEWHPNNRLKAGHRSPWPYSEAKDGSRVDLSPFPPRSDRVNDMSYISDMPEGWYAVTNTRLGVGFGVRYPRDVFPYLWYWQCLGGAFGYPFWGRYYNVGLEPFTSFANAGLASAIENGTAVHMEPGERIEATVKAVAFAGHKGVERIKLGGSVFSRV